MVIRSQSVTLAFWKLHLAAIHEQGGMAYPFSMCSGNERKENHSCGEMYSR